MRAPVRAHQGVDRCEKFRGGPAPETEKFHPEILRQPVAARLVTVRRHDDLRPEIGRVSGHEAVDERCGKDIAGALECIQSVDEAAHRLKTGRQNVDHAHIEDACDGRDFAACRLECQLGANLAGFDKIRVRKFLEDGDDIRVSGALFAQVAVWIKGRTDPAVRAGNLPHCLQKIALAIDTAVGDHGAMKAEDGSVQRQRCLQLAQHLGAQTLPGRAAH